MDYCICGRRATEEHHIIKRSDVTALIKCKANQKELCSECHRGTYGVHGKNGHKLDKRLKLEFQNYLEVIFDKEYFAKEDIGQALEITKSATDRLCKLMYSNKGLFAREDIIRSVMGGKIIESEEIR